MITFVVVAAAMLLAALAWILVPLLQRRPAAAIGREESNLAILRDARAELEADLANGTISAEQYEVSRAELDRRVLEETQAVDGEAATPPRSGALTAALVGAVLPIAAVVLYLALGTPLALSPDAARMAAAPDDEQHATSPQQIEAMIEQVKQKLASDPSNVDGWVVLARTYYVTGRAQEAAQAYEKATALLPDNADLLADYADALGVAQGRSLDGRPAELIARALKADPGHWKANALAGTIAFNRKEYAKAVAHWERTKAAVPPESPIAQTIAGSIAEARQLGGMPTAPAAAAAPARAPGPAAAAPLGSGGRVAGRVTLAPSLAANVSPDDAVVVFARPADGSRMPLALLSGKKVRDLPLEFALDDSMAMSPAMKLSDHGEVIVGARVSRSGSPMPASGDYEGLSGPVKLGTAGVALTIDRRLP
ncbi:MAG: c-type cytochrome biogenesis protein CcmI [Betaproteobacteria bacterium]|nr:MAG: c-type cytochrome biogenesis protein CcmI [Betaproteobacteria bacterium]